MKLVLYPGWLLWITAAYKYKVPRLSDIGFPGRARLEKNSIYSVCTIRSRGQRQPYLSNYARLDCVANHNPIQSKIMHD